MDLETTCQIPRDELLGLLNTMTPVDQQRVTAQMAAVEPPPDVELPPDLKIRFREPKQRMTATRVAVIGASFAVSFGIGILAAML